MKKKISDFSMNFFIKLNLKKKKESVQIPVFHLFKS